MEPLFQRGDLLFLTMTSAPIKAGDICVYKLQGKDIPIVHRILEVHEPVNNASQISYLTKGDNNAVDDRGLYNPGQLWIHPQDITGRVVGHLPYLGMVTIILNDYPQLKTAVLVGLGLITLLTKEEH